MRETTRGPFQPFAMLGLVTEMMQRLETDESYRNEVRADPIGTLIEVGIPADVAKSIFSLADKGIGTAGTTGTCCDLTCWSSVCPATCSVTVVGTTTCHCGSVLRAVEVGRPAAMVARLQQTLENTIEELQSTIER